MVIKLFFRNLFQLFVEVIVFYERTIKQRKTGGGLISGYKNSLIGCIFLFACRWTYNRGGAYKRQFTERHIYWSTTLFKDPILFH